MKTIAIMNYKGGVGKTVTTINFAAELAAAGKRVIVMDADGQCNLSDIFRADTMPLCGAAGTRSFRRHPSMA